jgi:hypothetical protein
MTTLLLVTATTLSPLTWKQNKRIYNFVSTQSLITLFKTASLYTLSRVTLSPVHIFTFYFLKINFNIALPSTCSTANWSLPFRFPDINVTRISHLPMSNPPHLYYPVNTTSYDVPLYVGCYFLSRLGQKTLRS